MNENGEIDATRDLLINSPDPCIILSFETGLPTLMYGVKLYTAETATVLFTFTQDTNIQYVQ